MCSAQLKTKLLVVMRNATTGSAWPVSNNPAAHYNDRDREDCNLNVPIWQLLRASTAAPTFFAPEQIDYDKRHFLFVDGGVTPFNNPALIAVLTATMPQYRLCWPTGPDLLHVISVGTGWLAASSREAAAGQKINLKDQWRFFIPAVLDTIAVQQDMLCRILGDCLFGDTIDREIGDLTSASLFANSEQKFSYVRYNQVLNTPQGLDRGAPLDTHLDRVENMPRFQQLGKAYAASVVRPEHLYPRIVATPTK